MNHQSCSFEVSSLSGLSWYGVAGATDIWQPVDGGMGSVLKKLINQEFFAWLDDDDNIDLWYGDKSHITASEKRILITRWVGNAYRKLLSDKYDSFRWRLFEKTGCLITADGSGDELIQPEGLPDYKVPAPIPLEPAAQPAEQPAAPSEVTTEEVDSVVYDDFEGDEAGEDEIEEDDSNDGNIFDIFELNDSM